MRIAFSLLTALLAAETARAEAPLPAAIEFNRDIRPILSDRCFPCHGPDRAKRKADLRLDTPKGAFADLGNGTRAVVPGAADRSELLRRATTANEKERMPPPRLGAPLTLRQVGLLRRWIEQGAKWQQHWSLLPARRPALPHLDDHARAWVRNGIDPFVRARLTHEGLEPAAEADKFTLIRRVSLDLTGLPPTPAEVDAFLHDSSPAAYEKVVDRLLASPRYGERLAIRWIDAARYADTNGYQSDGERFMWRWRDWVIEAFNRNLPFDQFTVEQLAGDLLPGATLDQKIASGFNRNHRGNAEGGIIPEEYAVEYVADRVETSATVWLGLTMTCARCHDHKFDPVTQKEYYQLFAYFNNVPERGKAVKYGNSPPMLKAPTRSQRERLQSLTRELAEAENAYRQCSAEIAAAQLRWENSHPAAGPAAGAIVQGLEAYFPFDGSLAEGVQKKRTGRFVGGEPAYVPGRFGQAADFDGQRHVDAGNLGDFGFYNKFTLAAWIQPHDTQRGTILSRMHDEDQAAGYQMRCHDGKLQVNLVVRWLDDALRVETLRRLESRRWHHVLVTYDGSRLASGLRIYVDGQPEKLTVLLDDLNQSFRTKEPLRIGGGGGPKDRFKGRIDDLRIYERCLSPEEVGIVAVPETIDAILALPAAKRSPTQADKLRAYFLESAAPASIRQAQQRLLRLRQEHAEFVEGIPTTMVMQEMPKPRDTFLLIRGAYDRPGAKVTPGVPARLPALPPGAPNNRLGFARWLVAPTNPLSARVTVNRFWQMYFGTGIVKSVEDFGSQGEWPSHPELLDWLATEFVRTGWDVKALQRLIVTSATYRQSSRVPAELRERDPDNRLLAHGPRFRLPAETIRDQALAASGLLVERQGGPSVKPYQPAGLWKELADSDYVPDSGAGLYRRTLYTFWKRTVAPPSLVTFDAGGRETCIVRATRTNTPLQALNMMNDVTYVEAARALAERVLREGSTTEERLTLAFRLVLARRPRPAELRVLSAGLANHLDKYRRDRSAARLLVKTGASLPDARFDVADLAAYTAVASLILNLDETMTKE